MNPIHWTGLGAFCLAATASFPPSAARAQSSADFEVPASFGDSIEGRLRSSGGTSSAHGEAVPQVMSFILDVYKNEYVGIALETDLDVKATFFAGAQRRDGTWKWVPTSISRTIRAGQAQQFVSFQSPREGKIRVKVEPAQRGGAGSFTVAFYNHWQFSSSLTGSATYTLSGRHTRAALNNPTRHWEDLVDGDAVVRARLPALEETVWTEDARSFAASKPLPLREYFAALYVGGEHNATLNFQKLGLAAMEAGNFQVAEWAFDEALQRIEAIRLSDEAAGRARSKFGMEATKNFKGEPYERAMTYFYRGILYLRSGDYENARASFRAAEYEDTVSGEETFQSDFALMNYLVGWSSRCMGDAGAAEEAFAIAQGTDPSLKPPDSSHNMLALFDTGFGPVKAARGEFRERLTIAASTDAGREERVRLIVDDGPSEVSVPLGTAASVHFQAVTRGGRPIDWILGGQVSFRRNLGWAVVPGILLGGLPLYLSAHLQSNTRPDADIRMWETLPDRVLLSTVGARSNSGGFFLLEGGPRSGGAGRLPLLIKSWSGNCGIAWGRSRSAIDAGAGVRGSEPEAVAWRAGQQELLAEDDAFRRGLRALPFD